MLWQPESCMDSKSLNNIESVPLKAHSCETWLNLAQWFRRRCCLKKLWTDGQTDDDDHNDDDDDGR